MRGKRRWLAQKAVAVKGGESRKRETESLKVRVQTYNQHILVIIYHHFQISMFKIKN